MQIPDPLVAVPGRPCLRYCYSVPLVDDATTRFSRRVNDYVRYRPGYPDELESVLRRRLGYHRDLVVADIESGTGISSRYFLDRGNAVFAVEPNQDMRTAELIKERNPKALVGMVGAKVMIEDQKSLEACAALDFVCREEYDFTCVELAEGRPLAEIDGITWRISLNTSRGCV